MKLSALLLTLAIAQGISAPLEARTKVKKAKVQHHTTQKAPKLSNKRPKVRTKPAKMKPMKFHKAKRSKTPKAPKVTPKSV
jgi:hypothetical protein